MTKIVVAQPIGLSEDQKRRLEKLGEVKYYDQRAGTPEEWLKRTKGYDVICTGVFGVNTEWDKLHDVFVSLPFVNAGWAEPEVLEANNVTICNSPGCNKHAVCEWIIGMLLMMTRQLDHYLNVENLPFNTMPPKSCGLPGRNMVILGKGNIGTCVAEVAKTLGMNVTFFRRGDNLLEVARTADVVVDTLSPKPETQNLLNKQFFDSLKGDVYLVTVSNGKVVNIDDMFEALDNGRLALAAHDASIFGATSDPLYQRILKHPKVYATPHIAHNTDEADKTGNDMMINNIEAWLDGRPINRIA